MSERLELEKKEEEERMQEEKKKIATEQEAKLKKEEERLKIIEKVGNSKAGITLAKRTLELPPRELNEDDQECLTMEVAQLCDVLNDPNAEESKQVAALRCLITTHGAQILEDEHGNKILIGADGDPLLDSNGKPCKIRDDQLEYIGAKLGE